MLLDRRHRPASGLLSQTPAGSTCTTRFLYAGMSHINWALDSSAILMRATVASGSLQGRFRVGLQVILLTATKLQSWIRAACENESQYLLLPETSVSKRPLASAQQIISRADYHITTHSRSGSWLFPFPVFKSLLLLFSRLLRERPNPPLACEDG